MVTEPWRPTSEDIRVADVDDYGASAAATDTAINR